jgi:hypothetical protein
MASIIWPMPSYSASLPATNPSRFSLASSFAPSPVARMSINTRCSAIDSPRGTPRRATNGVWPNAGEIAATRVCAVSCGRSSFSVSHT